MRYLQGEEEKAAIKFMELAAEQALKSTCLRSKCGSIITWQDNGIEQVIGRGFNSPPFGSASRCNRKHELPADFKSDKTCCVHAEQRAIFDAASKGFLPYHRSHLALRRLYFIRLDENDKAKFSGKPYCTICSKMTLDVGIKEFTLWHKEGICVYDALEYNELSFGYNPSYKEKAEAAGLEEKIINNTKVYVGPPVTVKVSQIKIIK